MINQRKFILNLLKQNKGATIVGSLGTISKDLEELDNGQNCILPIKGAMGCAMSIGLGIALSSKEKVIVLIGEGSFLMKLGSISTINKYKPKNLKVVILNNGEYASCGRQKNNYDLLPNIGKYLDKRTFEVYKVA